MAWHGTIASFGEAAQGDQPSLTLETAKAQHSRPLAIPFPYYPLTLTPHLAVHCNWTRWSGIGHDKA